jgi:hypothetical protein
MTYTFMPSLISESKEKLGILVEEETFQRKE